MYIQIRNTNRGDHNYLYIHLAYGCKEACPQDDKNRGLALEKRGEIG